MTSPTTSISPTAAARWRLARQFAMFLVAAFLLVWSLAFIGGPPAPLATDVQTAGVPTTARLTTTTTVFTSSTAPVPAALTPPAPTTPPTVTTPGPASITPRSTAAPATTPAPTTANVPPTSATVYDDSGGYHRFVGVTSINPRLVVRFQADVPMSIRAGIDQARQRINTLTGASWTIGAPTANVAGPDEVVVMMRDTTRCGRPTNGDPYVLACAVTTSNTSVVTAEIEFNPAVVGSTSLSTTILHELGHVAGLDDYNNTFAGSWQVMRASCVVGLTDYQAGDINGFLSLVR